MNLGFLARQKLRFDMGQGFLTVINFVFLVIAASDKIATLVHVEAKVLLAVLVPAAVLSVWGFGYALDRARFLQSYQSETNKRNEVLSKVLEQTQPKT